LTLAAAATNGKKTVKSAFVAGYEAIKSRGSSARIHDPSIAQQMAAMSTLDLAREKSTLAVRSARLADLRRHRMLGRPWVSR
jgi:hypothetical protein